MGRPTGGQSPGERPGSPPPGAGYTPQPPDTRFGRLATGRVALRDLLELEQDRLAVPAALSWQIGRGHDPKRCGNQYLEPLRAETRALRLVGPL